MSHAFWYLGILAMITSLAGAVVFYRRKYRGAMVLTVAALLFVGTALTRNPLSIYCASAAVLASVAAWLAPISSFPHERKLAVRKRFLGG